MSMLIAPNAINQLGQDKFKLTFSKNMNNRNKNADANKARFEIWIVSEAI